MPQYTDIILLPDFVKSALDYDAQMAWMKAFNDSLNKMHDLERARFEAWQSVKNHPSCRHFEGIVSTARVDKQGDVMDIDQTFEALKRHINRGGIGIDIHTNRPVSQMYHIEKTVIDGKPTLYGYGVVNKGEPYFDHVWELMKTNQRGGFSIGGFALATHDECDNKGCYRKIDNVSIHEVSHCPEPANPDALLMDFNHIAKGNVSIDSKHLAEDKAKLSRVKDIIEELLSVDENEKLQPCPCNADDEVDETTEAFEAEEDADEMKKKPGCSDKMKRCVSEVMAEGKDEESAHAICNSSLEKYFVWSVKQHADILNKKVGRVKTKKGTL